MVTNNGKIIKRKSRENTSKSRELILTRSTCENKGECDHC